MDSADFCSTTTLSSLCRINNKRHSNKNYLLYRKEKVIKLLKNYKNIREKGIIIKEFVEQDKW